MTQDNKPKPMRKYRLDIIVVASLLLLSLLVLLLMNLTRREGAYVEIVIDGSVVEQYPLSQDGVYSLNGGTNVLTIQGGVAYMSDSNCPDHICENIGRVKYVGQTIACRPNHLTVTVVGNADDSVDFVS